MNSTPPAPDDWADLPVAVVLPEPVAHVLHTAFRVLGSRPGANLGEVVTTTAARTVLTALAEYPALRQVTAAQAARDDGARGDDGPTASIAAALICRDPEEARQAAGRVRAMLDEARVERKRERRQARRAAGPTSEEKRLARDRELLDDARRERDRARAQRDETERHLAMARDRAQNVANDLEDVQGQLAATEQQLAALRLSLTDLPRAADRLRDALRPTPADAVPAAIGRQVIRPTSDTPAADPTGPQEAALRQAAGVALTDVMDADLRAQVTSWLPALLEEIARPTRLQSVTDLTLTVDVLGGGDEVGGSCVLITGGGTRILVDCGARPSGDDETTMAPPHIARALEGRLDAIVLTHAHNDHIGWVPAVVARQPDVPVIATLATCDLAATMWNDSARVLRRRTEGPGWRGKPLPPYTDTDVDVTVRQLRDVAMGRTVSVGALAIELFPAGHIVGAAGAIVTAGEQRVVVSGDVSRPGQKSVGGFVLPDSGRVADLMLLESTYGDDRKPTESRSKIISDFVKEVQLTVERGGVALVPSFALGRAQEIALICAEYLPDVDVLVDGLARDVSDIYEKHRGPDGEPLSVFAGNVRRVGRGRTIDEKLRLRSGVVIATSGMLNQGPAVEWARRVLPDRDSSVLLVGYQDSESPGKSLLRVAERGGGKFTLPVRDSGSEEVDVLARVEQFHLGAHANANELVTMSTEARAHQLMLVHGEVTARQQLAGRMLKRGQRMVNPGTVWQPGR